VLATNVLYRLLKINGSRKKLGADPRQAGVRGHLQRRGAQGLAGKSALKSAGFGAWLFQQSNAFSELLRKSSSPKIIFGRALRSCRWGHQEMRVNRDLVIARNWVPR